jgi:putative transposase
MGYTRRSFDEDPVILVTDSRLSIPEVGRRLSIPTSTVRNWVTMHDAGRLSDVGKHRKPLSEVEMELARQKRTGRGQDGTGPVKKGNRVLCEGVAARYAIVREMRLKYPVPRMCRFFKVSASCYYKWSTRPPSKRVPEERRLEVEIRAAHKRTRQTCGPERLQKGLAAHGVTVGIAGSGESGRTSVYGVNR